MSAPTCHRKIIKKQIERHIAPNNVVVSMWVNYKTFIPYVYRTNFLLNNLIFDSKQYLDYEIKATIQILKNGVKLMYYLW